MSMRYMSDIREPRPVSCKVKVISLIVVSKVVSTAIIDNIYL